MSIYDAPALFRILDTIETHLSNTASSLEHIESTLCKPSPDEPMKLVEVQNIQLNDMLAQLEKHNKAQFPKLSRHMCTVLYSFFCSEQPYRILASLAWASRSPSTDEKDRAFEDEVKSLEKYFKSRLEKNI